LALLSAALTACAPAPEAAAGLVIALDSEPQSLDPRFGIDANASRVADLLHVGLTRTGPRTERVGELAWRWTQPDPTTLVFDLRDDFRFADGAPVTAADVRATYEALRDPALGSPRRAALEPLAAVEAPDARTVVMRLARPFPPFLDATGLAVLPAGQAAAPATPLGAGPYRVRREQARERIVLEPNPHWSGPAPRIRLVTFRVVADPVVRILELQRGSVGLLQETFEPEILAGLARQPQLRVRRSSGSSVAYLGLNLRDPRLAARRVREAVALAIDRERLVRFVLGGAARPATGLLAPEHWAYAALPARSRDVARARRLLDRAGLPDPDGDGPQPRFRIQHKVSSQPTRRRFAEAVQAQLAEVGIAVDIRTYEWGVLFSDVRAGNYQLVSMAWVGITEPDHFFLTMHSSMVPPRGYNRGHYASAVMDRLTTQARYGESLEARRRWYARVQRRAARDLPVVPLWWEDRVVVHTAALHGFTPAPSGELRALAAAWLGE
jgi:peptide/nickel transport system substrate-binding protein